MYSFCVLVYIICMNRETRRLYIYDLIQIVGQMVVFHTMHASLPGKNI